MKYARECLADCFDEIKAFTAAHYAEAGDTRIAMQVDEGAYQRLELAGALRIYTARGARLCGYVSFIVANSNLHHLGLKYAGMDALYVLPANRGLTGTRLMAHAERELETEGVEVLTICVPVQNDWMPLAEHWGYQKAETLMRKTLKCPISVSAK